VEERGKNIFFSKKCSREKDRGLNVAYELRDAEID
jgi:hypothetical protein